MRRSRYAICQQLDTDEYVLFNTATGRFAACGAAAARAFSRFDGPAGQIRHLQGPAVAGDAPEGECEGAPRGEGTDVCGQAADAPRTGEGATPDEVADAAAQLVSDLVDAGFLVDDGRDEVAEQQARFAAARTDRDELWLAIAPTYACNCRCAYCYEQDKLAAKSLMTPEIEAAIYDFVCERVDADAPSRLTVEWYGGDPQLCLDLVARMSARLIGFCGERGIEYRAMMLSNSTRIGAAEAELLSDARISSMLITIDGPEDLHNARRPAVDVDNPYQAILAAIDELQAVGIAANVAMNTDRVNMARLDELRADLAVHGVDVSPVKLNDYAHTFNCPGEQRFCSPGFDLYTHEEFAHACYEQLAGHGFSRAQLSGLLSPADHFCSGQREAAYVIDAFGDLYKCDGWMGDRSRSIGNLLDGDPQAKRASTPVGADAGTGAGGAHAGQSTAEEGAAPGDDVHHAVTFDPFEDAKCRECELLPLCWGNCSWERELSGWPCHPLRYTMDRYLGSYRACFPAREAPFELLA